MRTLTEEPKAAIAQSAQAGKTPLANNLETFSATLRDGRIITIREMTGRDLVYVEEELSKMKETRKSFHIIEMLNVGTDKVSYNEIEALGVRDIRLISELVAKANGDFNDDSDEGGESEGK